MAVSRVHNFNSSGAMISSGADDPSVDEDPTANLPPGTRIHKDGQIDKALETPQHTPETVAALASLLPASWGLKMAKKKVPPKTRSTTLPAEMSDRRRCLELAIQSGADGPDAILAAAERFAAFLEG